MPIIGLGLHILLALFCAIHAVRTGQPMYWLIILFSFPLLGSIVYFIAIYLPSSRLERNARRVVSAAAKALDPERELRQARDAFANAPTAQNQMRLAAALLDAGAAEDAARMYEACLTGPFATDLEIRLGTARAHTECQRYTEAIVHLETIRTTKAEFRPETVSLLLARCYAGVGRAAEARAEYTIWALATGNHATAERLIDGIEKVTARWSSATRELNEPTMRRLRAAMEIAGQAR